VLFEKHHGRLEKRRIKRVAVTPEEIGLCGCYQVSAVRRERMPVGNSKGEASDDVLYYASSMYFEEVDDQQMLDIIRGHWKIENGSHHRRDVTYREDNCRVSHRNVAHALASFRNLAIGLYELEREKGNAPKGSMPSWCRQMKVTNAIRLLRKGSR
jgi:hypothetical protein